ncbi:MAG TPA: hypothetical protein VFX50_19220, partial [Gemmatimonadales bacterium]|nr:hypothetical protein [Gemmatimonadales bacterium]
ILAAAGRVPGALEFSAPGVRQAVLDQLAPQRREALRKAVEHGQRQLRDAGHRGHLPRVLGDARPRFALLRATLGLAGRLTGVAAMVRGTTP